MTEYAPRYLHLIRHAEPKSHKIQDGVKIPALSSLRWWMGKNILLRWTVGLLDATTGIGGMLVLDTLSQRTWKDSLSFRGRRQAREIGKYLSAQIGTERVDITSSDTDRAAQTTNILIRQLRRHHTSIGSVTQIPALEERDLGLLKPVYTGYDMGEILGILYFEQGRRSLDRPLPQSAVTEEAQQLASKLGLTTEKQIRGETIAELEERIQQGVMPAIKAFAHNPNGPSHLALISHKTTLEHLLAQIGVLPSSSIKPGSVVTLELSDKGWTLASSWQPRTRR